MEQYKKENEYWPWTQYSGNTAPGEEKKLITQLVTPDRVLTWPVNAMNQENRRRK